MSEPVQIGLREVYDEVRGIRAAFAEFTGATNLEVELLKRDVAELQKESARKDEKKWKVNLALLSAALSPVGAFVVTAITK